MKQHNTLLLLLLSMMTQWLECSTHLVVVVPSFNNATCYTQNLDSIVMQDYPNYHVIYIDDCSTDGTGDLVAAYIKNNNLHEKITLIRNHYNRKALTNIWMTIQFMTSDTDLITILDGDDAYAGPEVLSTIEAIHRTNDIWVSYAQYLNVPKEKALACGLSPTGYACATPPEIIKNKTYRSYQWSWSGLRSFYAWLFKQIKLEDLLSSQSGHEGKFYPICYDNALMFPLMEMAGTKCTFIEQILLLRNVDTPLNDFKVNPNLQRATSLSIRQKNKYPTLTTPVLSHEVERNNGDITIMANKIDSVEKCIMSVLSSVTGIKTVRVVCDASSLSTLKNIASRYSTISCISTDDWIRSLPDQSAYIMIIPSDVAMNAKIDIHEVITLLEKTHADAFYCDIDKRYFTNPHAIEKLPCEILNNRFIAWQQGTAERLINNFHAHHHALLMRKETIKSLINNAQQVDVKTLLHLIQPTKRTAAIGLSYLDTSSL